MALVLDTLCSAPALSTAELAREPVARRVECVLVLRVPPEALVLGEAILHPLEHILIDQHGHAALDLDVAMVYSPM